MSTGLPYSVKISHQTTAEILQFAYFQYSGLILRTFLTLTSKSSVMLKIVTNVEEIAWEVAERVQGSCIVTRLDYIFLAVSDMK